MSNVEESWLDVAPDRLFVRHWRAKGTAVATLVICHGFNAHSGHYIRAAESFAACGLAVTAFDLRGRGQSTGERFFVDDIAEYVSDLSNALEFARSRNPDLPLFLLGHSAGGVTAVSYAVQQQSLLSGLICESFAFQVFAPDLALSLLKGASHLVPHLHVLRLNMDDFSRDPEWVALLKADPLTMNETQPVQTVAALARASERLEGDFEKITLPLLILHGTADKAARPEGSQLFFDRAASADKQLILYDGYYHDLLNDVGRERVIADIETWIERRTA